MSNKAQATVTISAQNKLKAGIQDATNELGNFGKVVNNLGKLTIGAGIGAALYKIGEAAKKCVDNFLETEDAYLRMARALGKEDYNKAIKSIDKFSKYTKASREELVAMTSTMASMGKTSEEMDKITEAAIALSNVTGKDLNSSFEIMLDSLNGSTGEMEKFLPQVRQMTEDMKASGEAIDLVIEKFGDLSEEVSESSYSQTFKNIKDDLTSIGKSLGGILLNSMGPVFTTIEKWLDEIDERLRTTRGMLDRSMSPSDVAKHTEFNSTSSDDLVYLLNKFRSYRDSGVYEGSQVELIKAINKITTELKRRGDYKGIYETLEDLMAEMSKDIKYPNTVVPYPGMTYDPISYAFNDPYAMPSVNLTPEFLEGASSISVSEISNKLDDAIKFATYKYDLLNESIMAGENDYAKIHAEEFIQTKEEIVILELLLNAANELQKGAALDAKYGGPNPLRDEVLKKFLADHEPKAPQPLEMTPEEQAKWETLDKLISIQEFQKLNWGKYLIESNNLMEPKPLWDQNGGPFLDPDLFKSEDTNFGSQLSLGLGNFDTLKDTDWSKEIMDGVQKAISPLSSFLQITDQDRLNELYSIRENLSKHLEDLVTIGQKDSQLYKQTEKTLNGVKFEIGNLEKATREKAKSNSKQDNLAEKIPEFWSKENIEGGMMSDLIGTFGELFDAIQPIIEMCQHPIWRMIIEIVEGFVGVIAPAISQTIQPFFDALRWIGESIANLFMPIFDSLYPFFTIVAQIIETAIAPSLQLIAPFLQIVATILDAIRPILVAVAVAFEYVMAPVKWLGDLFSWCGEWIKTFGHNISTFVWNLAHPFRKRSYESGPGEFHSDAFSGLDERVDKILELNSQQGAISGSTGTAIQSASYQGGMTVTINNNFYSPVVGEDGMDQFATMIRDKFVELDYFGV